METPGFRRKLKPKTILVCEDDAMVAETLRMALSVDGHKVDTAGDGEQALGMFADAKYQLVITDFTIAKMDGLELAEKVKKLSPSTPVLLFTDCAELIRAQGGSVSNVDAVLGKPFSIREILATLERIFPE
jgi:DNA-binding response OmpR family regulator